MGIFYLPEKNTKTLLYPGLSSSECQRPTVHLTFLSYPLTPVDSFSFDAQTHNPIQDTSYDHCTK